MKIKSNELIEDLIRRTRSTIKATKEFKALDESALNHKPDVETWSVLECVEHLNLYGDFYLPELNKRISESKHHSRDIFYSGLLGNYFAIGMLPKEKLNKMKTFKDKNPNGRPLGIEVLDKFLLQQNETLEILEKSRMVDLTKTKTSISISKWIKLRFGDTLRVLIYHNERHMQQAVNTLKNNKNRKRLTASKAS